MILSIAVPNGIESGIFQLVKVALSSVVALFGTYQIAANGIAQSIWSMAALTSSALSQYSSPSSDSAWAREILIRRSIISAS